MILVSDLQSLGINTPKGKAAAEAVTIKVNGKFRCKAQEPKDLSRIAAIMKQAEAKRQQIEFQFRWAKGRVATVG